MNEMCKLIGRVSLFWIEEKNTEASVVALT